MSERVWWVTLLALLVLVLLAVAWGAWQRSPG